MQELKQITVTGIRTVTVVEKAGRIYKCENRPTYALSFCKSGKITYNHCGRQYVSEPSNAVIIPMGACYELYQHTDGEFPLINFTCAERFTDEFMIIPLINPTGYFGEYEKIRRLELGHGGRLKMMSIFYETLSRLSDEQKTGNPHLCGIVRYISDNIGNSELSNTEIAENAGISEIYMRKLFSAAYGLSPKQYITELRMEKSRKLLEENQISVSAVATQCGFSSVYHFCRAFKHHSGLTPTEYRRHNTIEAN